MSEKKFGYTDRFLSTKGTKITLEGSLPPCKDVTSLPKTWKLMTWNVWAGVSSSLDKESLATVHALLRVRMHMIVQEILAHDPDIVLLQEMSHPAKILFTQFSGELTEFSFAFHMESSIFALCSRRNIKAKYGREMDTVVLSKHPARSVCKYGLSGNLGYTAPVDILDFGQTCIVGVHLQAGSAFSPGKAAEWLPHFQRCRQEQMETIAKHVKHAYPFAKQLVLCGDFNFDLDGKIQMTPERKALSKHFGILRDAWDVCRKDDDSLTLSDGWTEDTKTNVMRWNVKRVEKQVRCDGILVGGSVDRITQCVLVGKTSRELPKDLAEHFLAHCCAGTVEGARELLCFPSDHYGVMATFERFTE